MTSNAESGATGAYQPAESTSELVRVLDQYLADLQAGRPPDRAQLLAAHPALAAQLEQCLAGIEFVHQAAQPTGGTPAQLGDFRIIREVGRGGMGVVYEAEQLSLKRKVALKVLRFGAVADAEVMQRFRREAETVARLHHTNIVPVFAVGEEHGVHYYAMQFIEGQSLADVLAESQAGKTPLDPQRIARWGLQAAEALAHAHQRGVIHRDIKPSNLLLDPEGVVWLTDFGLARRADEVTMTVTGVLLGTPRYMSPEQAAAAKQPVDHRTDIYSLGASLYELATGKPVFDADTPQGILSQIQNTEPAAPRQTRRDLPRDLETIILKCLAKEPGDRYGTAQELAADLHDFLNGRTIKARRPSLFEQAGRWARKQRRSVIVGAVAATVAVVLVAVGVLAARVHREAQLGWLSLTTDGPMLRAEVFEAGGEDPVVPNFTIPRLDPLPLPAGWYRMHVSAPGQLSETYQVLVEKGIQRQFTLGANDRQLWEPLEVAKADGYGMGLEVLEWVDRDGGPRADLIVLSTAAKFRGGARVEECFIRRVDGRTAKVLWQHVEQRSLAVPYPAAGWSGLIRPAPDVDGDGVPDLIWMGSGLRAVSGRDGTVLWDFQIPAGSSLVCPPLVADVDGDGRPDLIVVFARTMAIDGQVVRWEAAPHQHPVQFQVQTQVEAISGRTGASLWHYDLPIQTNSGRLKLGQRVVTLISASLQGFPSALPSLTRACREPFDRWTSGPVAPAILRHAAALRGTGSRAVAVIGAYRTVVGLDVHTGRPVWPLCELEMPLLALSSQGDRAVTARAGDNIQVSAIAPATGELLWRQATQGNVGVAWTIPLESSFWPLPEVADLDGDGKLEVLFPWQVLDGATGAPRWPRRSFDEFDRVREFPERRVEVVGPDVNGDGWRDRFRAYVQSGQPLGLPEKSGFLRTEVLSGADGNCLLRGQYRLGADYSWVTDRSVRWLAAKPGEYPRLILDGGPDLRDTVLLGGDGRLEHVWRGVTHVCAADLNGDGIPDLCSFQRDKAGVTRLHTVRGSPPEVWRRPGMWKPALRHFPAGAVTSVAPPMPHGDLDGDGIPDVLIFQQPSREPSGTGTDRASLRAYSGRSGCRLWQVDAANLGLEPDDEIVTLSWLECRDLKGDGRTDVVFGYAVTRGWRQGRSGAEGYTAVLDGRSGKVRWNAPNTGVVLALVDVNGDGVLDVVVGPRQNGRDDPAEYFAFDGRTGRRLTDLSRSAGDLLNQARLVEGSGGYLFLDGDPPRFDVEIYDLNGDGIPDRLSVKDGRLHAQNGLRGELLWECPLRNVELRAIRPASSGVSAVVVVKTSDGKVFGLDGATGRPRWRCDGPGWPAYLLLGSRSDDLPAVVFHVSRPEVTICLHALPTNPDGSYQRTADPPPGFCSPPAACLWTVPYPWEYLARQRFGQAFGLGSVYLAVLAVLTVKRRWGTVLVLAGCLLVLPLLLTLAEFGEIRQAVGESYTLAGWFLRWPYALTTWTGWGTLGNPWIGMALWLVGLSGWRVWQKLGAPAKCW